ncbi:hypothetical protein [Streptomyces sp. DH12]|uniref:hypothetical protein n=1 Tax=Streptomyces sp. DH12 TaxID=2857010 RepID=UPI001E5B32D6|nr:hypothetical protein [Streptomyces sp. DH12]
MSKHTATCKYDAGDTIAANVANHDVRLLVRSTSDETAHIYLSPADARDFARGILVVADEVEGRGQKTGEERTTTSPMSVNIGDRLRVTRDCLESAAVRVGDVVTVTGRYGSAFHTDDAEHPGMARWHFSTANLGDGLEFVDDPESSEAAPNPASGPTADEPVPDVLASRLEALRAAREFAGPRADSDSVLEYARYLTGEYL